MKTFFLYTVLVSLLFVWSCKEEITSSEPPAQEINPNKPNANNLILSQNILGDSSKGSSIYKIIDAGDGGFLLTGLMNSYYVLGKFNQSGGTIWTRRTSFRVKDILRVPENTGQIANALLAVGGYDSDVDGDTDGNVLLCNGTDGTLIGELILNYTNHDMWLNTLVMSSKSVDSCQYVGFGGAEVLGVYYPWATRFTIASNGIIAKRGDTLFSSFPWAVFSASVKNNELSQPSYFIKSQCYQNDSIETKITVLGLSDSLRVLWNQDIIHRSGFRTGTYDGRGITIAGGNLYIVGETDAEKNDNPPAGYWDAGLIASLTKQGQINWIKAVYISEYSEGYSDCIADGNFLWIVGDCSSFMKTTSKRTFANALLSKVDLGTDSVLFHKSFGNESYRSGFNSIVVRGNRAYCVGYTNETISDDDFQGWFAEVDISNLSLMSKEQIVNEKPYSDGPYDLIKNKSTRER